MYKKDLSGDRDVTVLDSLRNRPRTFLFGVISPETPPLSFRPALPELGVVGQRLQ